MPCCIFFGDRNEVFDRFKHRFIDFMQELDAFKQAGGRFEGTPVGNVFHKDNRSHETTTGFMRDVASRMRNRLQVSTDALRAYRDAVEAAFGSDVDYGQIVKVYGHDEREERRYAPPEVIGSEKTVIQGNPDYALISTSYVERLNATTRLHMRRLTRLTLAFSKRLENFRAAVGLHFAYYNFVRRHNTLRCTPAMAAGIEPTFWSVADLVEAVS